MSQENHWENHLYKPDALPFVKALKDTPCIECQLRKDAYQ